MKKITKDFLSLLQKPGWCFMKYDGRKKEFRGINRHEFFDAQEKAIIRRNNRDIEDNRIVSRLRYAYNAVKECSKPENGNYQKVAMYGFTWLYLCSPIYGHSDYNKSRLIPIKGHEKECEWLIKVSERTAKGGM